MRNGILAIMLCLIVCPGDLYAAPVSEECKQLLGLASYDLKLSDISVSDVEARVAEDKVTESSSQGVVKKSESMKDLINYLAVKGDRSEREYYAKITQPDYLTTFLWENDAFGNAERVDEKYTNGMKWSWVYNPCRNEGNFQKNALKLAINLFSPDAGLNYYSGRSFGMNMYTPNDIDANYRQVYDRPYAGWAYVGWLATGIMREGSFIKYSHTLELQAGVIGPVSAQGALQKYWHDDVGMSRHIPQGWQYQIGNRPGLNALYSYRRNYYLRGGSVRITPHAGFSLSLGTVADFVNYGAMIAYGKPKDDFPTTSIQPSIKVLGARPENDGYHYFFGGLDIRYIVYSRFIAGDGDARHDISLRNNVADGILGFAWKPNKCKTKFSYMLIYRTQEFDSPDPSLKGPHVIGQLSFIKQF